MNRDWVTITAVTVMSDWWWGYIQEQDVFGWCIPFYSLWHVLRQKLHTEGVPNTMYIVLNQRFNMSYSAQFGSFRSAWRSFNWFFFLKHCSSIIKHFFFLNPYGTRVKNFKNAALGYPSRKCAQGTGTLRERSTALATPKNTCHLSNHNISDNLGTPTHHTSNKTE